MVFECQGGVECFSTLMISISRKSLKDKIKYGLDPTLAKRINKLHQKEGV
jgi:hypothetical protein